MLMSGMLYSFFKTFAVLGVTASTALTPEANLLELAETSLRAPSHTPYVIDGRRKIKKASQGHETISIHPGCAGAVIKLQGPGTTK